MYRIAFFSDFHLSCVDEDFDRALALLWTAVDPEGEVCADHVVIVGDVVDCAQTKVVAEFADSLGEMGLLSSAMLTVVPGNHDVFPVSKRPPFLVPSRPTSTTRPNWTALSTTRIERKNRELVIR